MMLFCNNSDEGYFIGHFLSREPPLGIPSVVLGPRVETTCVPNNVCFSSIVIMMVFCNNSDEACFIVYVLFSQLIILMALARGTSRVRCGAITLHTETAIHIAQLLTKVRQFCGHFGVVFALHTSHAAKNLTLKHKFS